jgi:hypothetical protein
MKVLMMLYCSLPGIRTTKPFTVITEVLRMADDKDYFRVKVKAATPNLSIVLSEMTHDYNLKFYNPQKVLLATSNNTGTTEDTIIYNNLPAGTYYFQVQHKVSEFDVVNCYRLNLLKSNTIFEKQGSNNEFSGSTRISNYCFPESCYRQAFIQHHFNNSSKGDNAYL